MKRVNDGHTKYTRICGTRDICIFCSPNDSESGNIKKPIPYRGIQSENVKKTIPYRLGFCDIIIQIMCKMSKNPQNIDKNVYHIKNTEPFAASPIFSRFCTPDIIQTKNIKRTAPC